MRLERGGDSLAARVGGEGEGREGKSLCCSIASSSVRLSSGCSATVLGLTLRPTRASARCRALRLLEGRAEAVGYSGCAAGKGPSACAGAVPGGGTSVTLGFCVALLHFSCSGALGAVRGAWRLACELIRK